MTRRYYFLFFFFFQAEDGIRDIGVTGVQTCALPSSGAATSKLQTSLNNPIVRRKPVAAPEDGRAPGQPTSRAAISFTPRKSNLPVPSSGNCSTRKKDSALGFQRFGRSHATLG